MTTTHELTTVHSYRFTIYTATRQQCFDGTVTFCLEPEFEQAQDKMSHF